MPKLTQRLEQALQARTDKLRTIEPVPCDAFRFPDEPVICAFEITRNHEVKVMPAQCLGVDGFTDATEGEAVKHATVVAVGLLGDRVSFSLRACHMQNPEYGRRAETQALNKAHEQSFGRVIDFAGMAMVEWNTPAIKRAKLWVRELEEMLDMGRGLSIMNPQTGCGKTNLMAAAIMAAAVEMPLTRRYVFVPDLLGMSFGAELEQQIKLACECDLVLLDDVDASVRAGYKGNDEDSSHSRKTLLRITNARQVARRPTFWTSNAKTPGELEQHVGERVARRLYDGAIPLVFGPGAWDWGARPKE